MESFFHSLKTEWVVFEDYKTRSEARTSLFDYIELFYNRKRRHSALKYRSTMAFETPGLSPNQGVRFSGVRSTVPIFISIADYINDYLLNTSIYRVI